MASRRQVREAAVQLLYARCSNLKSAEGSEFWALIHHGALVSFDKARVKILAHLQQGRLATAQKLQAIVLDCAASILATDPSEKLAKEIKSLTEDEIQWADTVKNLSNLTKANLGGWQADLIKLLVESNELKKKRATIRLKTENFPPLQQTALDQVFDKLDSYDKRVHMVHFPKNYSEQRELAHLHQMTSEMKELEDEVTKIADLVTEKATELDELIGLKSENFDLSRLSKVDLAILRLASWEILYLTELDPAISINEAIELARAFCGEDSASFVNGILDQVAKSTSDHSQQTTE